MHFYITFLSYTRTTTLLKVVDGCHKVTYSNFLLALCYDEQFIKANLLWLPTLSLEKSIKVNCLKCIKYYNKFVSQRNTSQCDIAIDGCCDVT